MKKETCNDYGMCLLGYAGAFALVKTNILNPGWFDFWGAAIAGIVFLVVSSLKKA